MFRRKNLERTVKRQGERIIELEEELQKERECNSDLWYELENAQRFRADVLKIMAGHGLVERFEQINELTKHYI